MASKTKKLKAKQKAKDKPNKPNMKADVKRVQSNTAILRELDSKDQG